MRLDNPKIHYSMKERFTLWFYIVLVVFILLPSAGAFKTLLVDNGFVSHHQVAKDKLLQLASDIAATPARWFYANNDLPLIKVDIKYQQWLKLESDRSNAIASGQIADNRHEVGATVYFEQNKYQAKVRLQGDMLDHVNNRDRWSLKLSLKNKQAIMSSRRFALIAPSVRVNQGSSLFAKTMALAEFDVISPKHIPARVIVNGADWGVMLFEQAFSQDLLAVNNRTEGLITRLDLIEENTNKKGKTTRLLKPRVIQQKTVLGNHALAQQRQIALSLLDQFLNGQLSASDVFDAKRLGQYLATVDLWGAWHALTWNNWRWYYNPHTAKLEPIQSDVAVTPAKHIWLMRPPSHRFELSKAMLEDEGVKTHYLNAKRQLLNLIDNALIGELIHYERQFIRMLHAGNPLVAPFDFTVMQQQADCWADNYQSVTCRRFNDFDPSLHLGMDVYHAKKNWDLVSHLKTSNGQLVWTVRNNGSKALRIKGIEGVTKFNELSPLEEQNNQFPLLLMPNQTKQIEIPRNINALNVRAGFKDQKMGNYLFIKNTQPLDFVPRPDKSMMSEAQGYDFITQTPGTWRFKKGTWQINDYLVTPKNTQVIVPQGTRIEFAKNAGLMVFGSLHINGSEKSPVTFTKQAGNQKWSGLSVFAATEQTKSKLDHFVITHASSPKLALWQPRGATYFVGGYVDINHLLITDNQSEDGLNIINGQVNIANLTIKDALSDAFDCDFCKGTLTDSAFKNIGFRSGGDGLDVSGSELALKNVSFEQIRDKAISGGERSQLNVTQVRFDEVNFGLVAKDDTVIEATDVTASNIKHHALMSYSKKRYFGSAKMNVTNFTCEDIPCDHKVMVEHGSELVVNGLLIQAQKLDVKNLYNTIMKSDKPK